MRLITLDLDDTLWPCGPVIQAAETALFAWLREHAPRITARHDVASLRAHRMALLAQRPELGHDLTRLRLHQLQLLMAEHGHDAGLAQAAADHFRAARNRVSPYPEVHAALQRLRQDYLLVSVTNGNAQVEHTPLAGCFHYNLSAADVGAAKPDPALFHAACDWAGVPVRQALHVGDDPLRDIAAADAIGMRTAWLNRGDLAWPAHLPAPALQTRDLAELAHRLNELQREQHP